MAGADGGADEASGSESYCVLFLPLRVKLRALMRRARGVLVRDDAGSLAAEAIPALAASAVAASVPAAPAADFADSLAAAGGNFELEHADFFFFFTRFFCNDSVVTPASWVPPQAAAGEGQNTNGTTPSLVSRKLGWDSGSKFTV